MVEEGYEKYGYYIIYGELFSKILYVLTDMDFVIYITDEYIEYFVNKYKHVLDFNSYEFEGLFKFYFYDFQGNYFPFFNDEREENVTYYNNLAKIFVRGNIENLIEMDIEDIKNIFQNMLGLFYNEKVIDTFLYYLSKECISYFDFDEEVTKKLKIFLMEYKLKKY